MKTEISRIGPTTIMFLPSHSPDRPFSSFTLIQRNGGLINNLTLSASICGYLLIKCCLLTRNDYRRILRLWSLSKKSLDHLQIIFRSADQFSFLDFLIELSSGIIYRSGYSLYHMKMWTTLCGIFL